MDLRERIKQEFDANSVKSTKVREWGENGKPLEVCCKPMTLAELSKIQKYAGEDEAQMCVYTVIFKALDGSGEPLFSLEDKGFLMNGANPAVVARIAKWILKGAGSAKTAAVK
jgi:hypothetical protein